jgi:SAM-dependent methyltransferase
VSRDIRKATLHERSSLWVLKAAKRGKKGHRESGEFYEEFFDEAHAEQFEKDIRAVLKRQEVQRAIAGLRPKGVWVDLGCGVGHTLRLFPEGVLRVGLEYSKKSLSIARRHLGDGPHFARACGERLPMADGTADVLACFEVLEHLPDDRAVLREINRVLREGGHFLVSVPDTYYFPEYLQLMGHFRHYDGEAFQALLGQEGFSVEEHLRLYPRTNRRYFPLYVLFEAFNRAANLLFREKNTIYQRCLPFSESPFYGRWLAPGFLKMGDRERAAGEKPSTFLLARKTSGGAVRPDPSSRGERP